MSTTLTFDFLPETIEEFMNIPESGCRTPHEAVSYTHLKTLISHTYKNFNINDYQAINALITRRS